MRFLNRVFAVMRFGHPPVPATRYIALPMTWEPTLEFPATWNRTIEFPATWNRTIELESTWE